MKNKKICFVTINANPEFLGGYVLYHKNLIKYLQRNFKNLEINWVYLGKENRNFSKNGVHYFELKTNKLNSFLGIGNNFCLAKFFKKNYFDVINSIGGLWTYFYKKKKNQRIIQTFHGTVYYFNKNHLKRFNLFQKFLIFPLLLKSWFVERPHKKVDKIICVSEKVKKQAIKLYSFEDKQVSVIRTGVDLKEFKQRDKSKAKKFLNLNKDYFYGLYVGGGGYWTKGLDRAINLGKEIYQLDNSFRLLVIGPDYEKVKPLLNEPFIVFLKKIPREKMSFYYSASDLFFCMSRYEGGAPTLVVSEAMASGCLLVCSKDSEQEIVEDNKTSLIIEKFDKSDAKRILEAYKSKVLKNEIIKNSFKKINELSLEKWGKKTAEVLLK
ncbi:MAG TPA: glycosyltransferase family 4 protein [Nanoarchaeota archaeon]|nr:glycosyltransferase family 4 protein [Nanoarchaeota archaeon]